MTRTVPPDGGKRRRRARSAARLAWYASWRSARFNRRFGLSSGVFLLGPPSYQRDNALDSSQELPSAASKEVQCTKQR
jgi:hypothetical protein